MKKILFLLCFISTIYSAFSQNIDPAPLSGINFENDSIFSPRKQTRFTLGWQWAGPIKKVNERLHINTYHSSFGSAPQRLALFPTIADSGGAPRDLVWQHLVDGYGNAAYLYGFSMQFDPTAPTAINEANPVRTGDTTGAVLGFTERNMRIGQLINSGENFNRYLLRKDSITAGADSIVLKEPVINHVYEQYADINTLENRQWLYLTVNLRLTDAADTIPDPLTDNLPILTIKVP